MPRAFWILIIVGSFCTAIAALCFAIYACESPTAPVISKWSLDSKSLLEVKFKTELPQTNGELHATQLGIALTGRVILDRSRWPFSKAPKNIGVVFGSKNPCVRLDCVQKANNADGYTVASTSWCFLHQASGDWSFDTQLRVPKQPGTYLLTCHITSPPPTRKMTEYRWQPPPITDTTCEFVFSRLLLVE